MRYYIGKFIKWFNRIYFNYLNPTLSAINYNTENTEELKEVELVIIDNDYIYSEDEFNSLPKNKQYNYLERVENYEIKYQNEINRRKKWKKNLVEQ